MFVSSYSPPWTMFQNKHRSRFVNGSLRPRLKMKVNSFRPDLQTLCAEVQEPKCHSAGKIRLQASTRTRQKMKIFLIKISSTTFFPCQFQLSHSKSQICVYNIREYLAYLKKSPQSQIKLNTRHRRTYTHARLCGMSIQR